MGPGFLHAYVVNMNLATRAHAIRLACQHGKLVIRTRIEGENAIGRHSAPFVASKTRGRLALRRRRDLIAMYVPAEEVAAGRVEGPSHIIVELMVVHFSYVSQARAGTEERLGRNRTTLPLATHDSVVRRGHVVRPRHLLVAAAKLVEVFAPLLSLAPVFLLCVRQVVPQGLVLPLQLQELRLEALLLLGQVNSLLVHPS
mgnify:CR=1 FL=1